MPFFLLIGFELLKGEFSLEVTVAGLHAFVTNFCRRIDKQQHATGCLERFRFTERTDTGNDEWPWLLQGMLDEYTSTVTVAVLVSDFMEYRPFDRTALFHSNGPHHVTGGNVGKTII